MPGVAVNKGRFRAGVDDQSGSLSLAITSIFLLTLVISFSIIDISGAFLAKRELANIGEEVVAHAVHNLDTMRYYNGDHTQIGVNSSGSIYFLPIDCSAAEGTVLRDLGRMSFHNSQLVEKAFRCDGDQVWVTLSTQVRPILNLPLIQGSVMNDFLTITADVNAGNIVN